MMYATRKELNQLMKRAFGRDEKLALLVWTREDVKAVATMTEAEADAILCAIGNAGLGDHQEEGVSFRTVHELLAGLRAETRMVPVPSDLLARITETARRALSAGDAQAWELARHSFPSVNDALCDVAWLEKQLAA
ncbi:hypothetical protein BL250_08730 [Erwinia sp. OLTSP20]|uniref:DUF1380 family protein n=1 Tax=unclassified Erwinia TaxID=2622719 RepID=UPI000C180F73|nr:MULTISPECIES: DUF1380 family protein [unclassified Erwinia]PIJ50007.1 hypothetical protein BV501_10285 [Erwinia sp. OAMSP11]PIJ72446.1 hypothetical protein BK416_09505 [Erwinia sp. OLSSP12]PIJ80069.1 hypothetical protein BLD47_12075 [Erwinia sp. OLCASP19]PIJ82133.1 hypothetical protein BLD46_11660 [Erwinia sp. OLMTSP26]PIJ86369.1 hypothetical protein BLD49_08355 [Erwinia sp. OLMDSP33]